MLSYSTGSCFSSPLQSMLCVSRSLRPSCCISRVLSEPRRPGVWLRGEFSAQSWSHGTEKPFYSQHPCLYEVGIVYCYNLNTWRQSPGQPGCIGGSCQGKKKMHSNPISDLAINIKIGSSWCECSL